MLLESTASLAIRHLTVTSIALIALCVLPVKNASAAPSVYVTSDTNCDAFYDCQSSISLKSTPTATDRVLRLSTSSVVYDGSARFVTYSTILPTQYLAVCEATGTTLSSCPEAGGFVQKSMLKSVFQGSTPPPVVDPPIPQNGSLVVTWTAPTTNPQGQPVTITGYHVRWGTGEYITGNVLTYTIVGPPGPYIITVAAIDATGESVPSNPVTGTIASTVPPVDPPPTVSVVTVGFATGVTQIPVYGVTAAGARSSTVLGVINLGVACIGPQVTTYRGQGLRKVPRASVIWHQTTPTDAAIAACR